MPCVYIVGTVYEFLDSEKYSCIHCIIRNNEKGDMETETECELEKNGEAQGHMYDPRDWEPEAEGW